MILLVVVPLISLEAVKHDTLGIGRCIALQIMDYLWDTDGAINDNQLEETREK